MTRIRFCTMATSDYLPGALTLKHSIEKHNPWAKRVPWFIISPDIRAGDFPGRVIRVLPADYRYKSRFPRFGNAFCKLALFRDPRFRENGIDRIIFLDADILCLGDIRPLAEYPSLFARAPDAGGRMFFPMHRGRRRYNSGVLVMRRPFLHEYSDRVFQIAARNDSYDGGDQGVLNDLVAESPELDFGELPVGFNALRRLYEFHRLHWEEMRAAGKIRLLHFVGSKPWENAAEDPELVKLWQEAHRECSSL